MGATRDEPGRKSRASARAHTDLGNEAPRDASHAPQSSGADHAALGAAALQMRRAKRYDEALDLYRQAAAAAHTAGDAAAHATWTSKQGNIHRLLQDPLAAERAYQSAFEMFEAIAGPAGLAGLADQEGGLGLIAADRGDDFAAEFAYRRAVDLAMAAKAWSSVNTWACNLGNALTRRRRYHGAWEAYEQAIEAGKRAADAESVIDAAERLSDSYAAAGRWADAASVLEVAIQHSGNPVRKAKWALEALRGLMRAGEWQRACDAAQDVPDLLRQAQAPAASSEQAASILRDARRALAAARAPAPPPTPPLDDVAIGAMAHYENTGGGSAMAWVGHLVADVHIGLGAPRLGDWRRFLSQPELYYRIVGDVMYALCQTGEAQESFLLSQRMKGAAFAQPFLARAHAQATTAEPALRAYLDADAALRAAVDALGAAAPHARHALAHSVRAAGEALLESGELLADADRDVLARLGGAISPRHLLDALPVGDPVCILDFVMTNKGMLVHAVLREGAQARVVAISAPELSGEAMQELALAWGPEMVRVPDLERHRAVLDHIGKVLHDRLFCHLAHWVTEQRAGQVIIVPDLLTRHLPLHLARVCAKDIAIPGVPTEGAEYFCEVLPVEYAPCVQAVALSQHQRRPANVKRVASFADAAGDLAGARYTGNWLGTRISKDPVYLERSGDKVTRAAVEAELCQAELVLIGTHGVADSAHPERSCLKLHDADWTAADIAALAPLAHSPAVILAACEVAAANPGDDPAAEGVPGALIAAGAAFVLGSRWPGEDVSMGLLIERFLHHSTSIGLRPAAVLFRAVRDLRRMPRDEVVARCRELLTQMQHDGLPERDPDTYSRLDWFALQIEEGQKEHPFEAPFYWGGVVVVGSGWSGMAGGAAGGERVIHGLLELESVRTLLQQGRAREAHAAAAPLVGQLDGVLRVQALEFMAEATARSTHPACRATARAEAEAWLREAMFVARAEQREQLLRNIAATGAKIKLLLED